MSQAKTPLEIQIDLDLKDAMRNKDNVAKLVLRSVKTALTEEAKSTSQDTVLSEDEVMDVIQREAKRRRDAAAEYEKAGRSDRAAEEMAELTVLERYLPQQLSEEEIRVLATEVIAEIDATSMRDMGAVMSAIMPRVAGRADGRRVNQVVRSLLS
jgi:uncharacterized protein YqeY